MLSSLFKRIFSGYLLLLSLSLSSASALEDPSVVPIKTEIIEKLGDSLDLDQPFIDEQGNPTSLRTLLSNGLPAILTPVYYSCPSLCTHTLNGVLDVLDETSLKLGKDFTIISYSIDPTEQPRLAAKKKESYISHLNKDKHDGAAWHFLTGNEAAVKDLSAKIGFQYFKDGKEYAHSAILLVLTPNGTVSRYLYGIKFPEENFRLSLVEAAEGKVGSTFDKILLFCFSYDHISGQYTLAVLTIVRVVCVAFLLVLVAYLWRVYRRSEAARAKQVG